MPPPTATQDNRRPGEGGSRAEACRDKSKTVRLPVIDTGPDGSPIRPSRAGKWRALSLMLVHVLIVGHVLHWLWTGRTISPIEPSEGKDLALKGEINAGLIFFALAILSTVVFGRWVCGWGCHLVAYQDLTNWLLKKLHLRPKAFRSRLLIFVPLVAAIYMFVWPAVYRMVFGLPQPHMTMHVMRTGFWDTFPDYGIAILTVLVCGVAIIYFLGAKGFCTYACPYGAFFGLVDKFAIGRIRVTDACNQCGHCTAVCTSNVNVAQEVKLHKMVVDPGCMKCLDCVSVCPNDALYFGFGAPSLTKAPAAARFDLTMGEELLALIVFSAAFLSFRGLYGKVPFLMSLGMAGIVSYMTIKGVQLLYRPDVLVQKIRLRVDSRLRGEGLVYIVGLALVVLFTVHSGFWRYHDYRSQSLLATLPSDSFGWQRVPGYFDQMASEERQRAVEARMHLAACERWGLFRSVDSELQLAWLLMMTVDGDAAIERVERIAREHSDDAGFWLKAANFETYLNRYDRARTSYARAIAAAEDERTRMAAKRADEPSPISGLVLAEWGMFLADRGEVAAARTVLDDAVRFDRTSAPAWLARGSFQLHTGQIDEARRSLIRGVTVQPGHRQMVATLEQLARSDQDFATAVQEYRAALTERPNELVFRHNLAHSLARAGQYADAENEYREVLKRHPDAIKMRAELGAILLAAGNLSGAISEYETVTRALPNEPEALFKLGFLYQQAGRIGEAREKYESTIRYGGPQEKQLAEQALRQLATQPRP